MSQLLEHLGIAFKTGPDDMTAPLTHLNETVPHKDATDLFSGEDA